MRSRLQAIISDEIRPAPWLGRGLKALSHAYGALMRARAYGYQRGWLPSNSLPCPVISVGNLTVGGTGKTPLSLYLARGLCRRGYRVSILSRGYGGTAQKKGGVVGNGREIFMDALAAGDEPLMMAKSLAGVPVLVGGDRYRSGCRAWQRFQPDILLLDDGFQHLRLRRDIDLLLLDSQAPFGNGYALPRGPLREPMAALQRADALIRTRWSPACGKTDARIQKLAGNQPIFCAAHHPRLDRLVKNGQQSAPPPDILTGQAMFAFSGIADNPAFFNGLKAMGAQLCGALAFADHHFYDQADIKRIQQRAAQADARILGTTQKDFARLSHLRIHWPLPLAVVGVEMDFGPDTRRFWDWLERALPRR